MTSAEMKEHALTWFRWDKQLAYLATEFGNYSADVFAASREKTYEVEIKVSLSDLRADFKKGKHRYYRDPSVSAISQLRWGDSIPQYFFFLVPPDLGDAAVAICIANAPKYGVVVCNPEARTADQHMRVLRRSTRLHTVAPSPDLLDRIARRMGSELVSTYLLKNKFAAFQADIRARAAALSEGGREPRDTSIEAE